jgi:hypothetical protein
MMTNGRNPNSMSTVQRPRFIVQSSGMCFSASRETRPGSPEPSGAQRVSSTWVENGAGWGMAGPTCPTPMSDVTHRVVDHDRVKGE